ncbi:hypothetical protein KXD40_004975 [Peronospora effusa]|uniref:Uncharacterized protein n=1 Tax=Peronospora effusa TaxID=542832 RepID=A0A3M6V7N8_9STRA|nr:hypothetical protein DD238_008482 [Peronospora effusa]UIZ22199.1 hypothetical protein KXD40_004975 [Peronospora effusa]CAI5708059.1 unnamed protein product [Peronospora effusa]
MRQFARVCGTHCCIKVDKLGFSMPNSTRSLETVDELKILLQKHVFQIKREIESMQMDAQMRSVALEVPQDFKIYRNEPQAKSFPVLVFASGFELMSQQHLEQRATTQSRMGHLKPVVCRTLLYTAEEQVGHVTALKLPQSPSAALL